MNSEPRLFRINPQSKESQSITEVDFAQLGFQERRDIQEWVSANPGILEDELLIVGKEFSGFDKTNERLDLLAVDSDGKVVVIELNATIRAPMPTGRLSSTPVICITPVPGISSGCCQNMKESHRTQRKTNYSSTWAPMTLTP